MPKVPPLPHPDPGLARLLTGLCRSIVSTFAGQHQHQPQLVESPQSSLFQKYHQEDMGKPPGIPQFCGRVGPTGSTTKPATDLDGEQVVYNSRQGQNLPTSSSTSTLTENLYRKLFLTTSRPWTNPQAQLVVKTDASNSDWGYLAPRGSMPADIGCHTKTLGT